MSSVIGNSLRSVFDIAIVFFVEWIYVYDDAIHIFVRYVAALGNIFKVFFDLKIIVFYFITKYTEIFID